MGKRPKLVNVNGKEWESTAWEWVVMGILKNTCWQSLYTKDINTEKKLTQIKKKTRNNHTHTKTKT